jgi:hypothetical protein
MTDTTTANPAATPSAQPTSAPPASQPADTSAPAPAVTPAATQPAPAAAAAVTEPAKADDKPAGAPESYEFTHPEGASLDDTGIAAFSEFAKGQNLTQEAAQKLLDSLAPAMAASAQARHTAQLTEWADTSKADPEFGGAKFDENLAIADKALTTFGKPEFVEFLKSTGLANHPEMIRTFLAVGKQISETRLVVGGSGPHGENKSAAQRLFPNMNP